MTYTLNVKETGNKSAKYHYIITDEQGNVISERRSNRVYVAATINGQFYFGRRDLVGKGEHADQIRYDRGYIKQRDVRGKYSWVFDPSAPVRDHIPVAYLKTEENSK